MSKSSLTSDSSSEQFIAEKRMDPSIRSLSSGLLFPDSSSLAGDKTGAVRLSMVHSKKRRSFRRENICRILDAKGDSYADGAYFKQFRRGIGQTIFLLYDTNDRPVALCVQERLLMNKKTTIYGTQPLHHGQPSTAEEEGIEFYKWFRICDIDQSHLLYRPIYVWNGETFRPLLKAIPANKKFKVCKRGEILIVNARDEMLGLTCPKEGRRGWDVSMAPGVDPAFMLCIAATMEEMVGFFAS